MRPISLTGRIRLEENFGGPALFLDGMNSSEYASEMYGAQDGMLFAHDVIEHVNGLHNIGPIGDELEALGATWWTRGRHGDITRHYNMNTAEQHCAATVVFEILRPLCEDPRLMPSPVRAKPCDDDDAFHFILDLAYKEVPSEIGEPADDNMLRVFRPRAVNLMRRGYHKQKRRFPANNYEANSAFWALANLIDKTIKRSWFFREGEGWFRLRMQSWDEAELVLGYGPDEIEERYTS